MTIAKKKRNNDPYELLPIAQTRLCDKCNAYTWWAAPGQRTRGRCFDCHPVRPATEADDSAALAALMVAFPGATLASPKPRRYAPDTYTGPDAGPCEGCRRRVRRYGDHAYTYCLECKPREG